MRKFQFDPIFAKYGWEDIDLGYRLQQQAGLKLYYSPQALAYHYHYLDESGLPARMQAVGRSAVIFHRRFPELKKVPGVMKRLIFAVLTSWPLLLYLKLIYRLSSGRWHNWYFYLLSKKYFLKGVKEGLKA